MKQKIYYLSLILCVMAIFTSCNKDDLIEPAPETNIEEFKFTYKGVNYSSDYFENEEGEIILANEEMNTLINNLANISGMATIFHYDGSIEFLDSEAEAQKRLDEGTLFKERPSTKLPIKIYKITSSRLDVFSEGSYKGSTLGWNNTMKASIYKPGPVLDNWDVRSFKFSGTFEETDPSPYPGGYKKRAVATFYEGDQFNGNSFWHAIDNNMKTNDAKNMPSVVKRAVYSFKVEWVVA